MSGNTSLSTSKLLLPHLVKCLKKKIKEILRICNIAIFFRDYRKGLMLDGHLPVLIQHSNVRIVTFTEFKQAMSNKKSAENYFIQSHYSIRKTVAPS